MICLNSRNHTVDICNSPISKDMGKLVNGVEGLEGSSRRREKERGAIR